jgi:hypothetical protein
MYGPTNQLTIMVTALSTQKYGHPSYCALKKKTKSHNTLVQYGCILAKQVPLLTIPNVIVKQWFKAAATNSIKCH